MGGLLTISTPLQALLATIFTWSVTALGAAVVMMTRRMRQTAMDAMLGFGAGVMLASSFWSLLEPGIALADELGQICWLMAGLGLMAGSALLLVGDALLTRILPEDCSNSRKRTCLLMASITLHNIPEGLAIGVAFGALAGEISEAALTSAWMLALGIALQNFPEGTAVSLPLRREGMSRRRAFWYGQLSGIVEPIAGVLGALLAVKARAVLPFMLTFAAGAMIAVVVGELVPESQRNPRKSLMTFATLLGFMVMMVLDVGLS